MWKVPFFHVSCNIVACSGSRQSLRYGRSGGRLPFAGQVSDIVHAFSVDGVLRRFHCDVCPACRCFFVCSGRAEVYDVAFAGAVDIHCEACNNISCRPGRPRKSRRLAAARQERV